MIDEEPAERVVVRLAHHHPPRAAVAFDARRLAPTRAVQSEPTTSGLQPGPEMGVVILGWNGPRDVRHEQTGRGQPPIEVGVVGRDGGATVIERGELVQEAQAGVVHVVGGGAAGWVAADDQMDG